MSNWCNSDNHGNIISARWPGVVTINNPEHRRVTTVTIRADHEGNVTVETCVTVEPEAAPEVLYEMVPVRKAPGSRRHA